LYKRRHFIRLGIIVVGVTFLFIGAENDFWLHAIQEVLDDVRVNRWTNWKFRRARYRIFNITAKNKARSRNHFPSLAPPASRFAAGAS
jgi:hypothetical protein